jgi:multidrug efflux system outer membrane protein
LPILWLCDVETTAFARIYKRLTALYSCHTDDSLMPKLYLRFWSVAADNVAVSPPQCNFVAAFASAGVVVLRRGVLLFAFTIAGCASVLVVPNVDVSRVPVPAGWSNGTANASAAAPAEWWQRFDDPQLASLIKQALIANSDLRTARAALLQSRALRDVTAAGLSPDVSASASAQRSIFHAPASANLFQAGLSAPWAPDIFGGVRAAVAAADANDSAAAASLGNVQISIAAETATVYLDLATFERRLAVARDNLASQEEILQIAEWRAQAGLTTSLDVAQARTSTEQTRALIPPLQASMSQSRSSMAVLTGVTPEAMQASFVLPTRIPAATSDLAFAFPAETLRQRPDVRQAEYKIFAAASQVTQADAAHYPTFNLNGTLGLSAFTLSGLGASGAVLAALLGSVSVPLFDGGAASAQVRAQEAALDQARIAYEATVLSALKDVEDALASVRTSHERLSTLYAAAEAAQLASLLARNRYTSGLIDFQPVLTTQLTLLQVQDSVAAAEGTLGAAYVRLYKALGGGWQQESPALTARDADRLASPPTSASDAKS